MRLDKAINLYMSEIGSPSFSLVYITLDALAIAPIQLGEPDNEPLFGQPTNASCGRPCFDDRVWGD